MLCVIAIPFVQCSKGAASFVCECANGWSGPTCEEEGCKQDPGSITFDYTGEEQTFVIPECLESVTIEVWGAEGGDSDVCGGSTEPDGGNGGYAKGTLTVSQGETLYIYVGGRRKGWCRWVQRRRRRRYLGCWWRWCE